MKARVEEDAIEKADIESALKRNWSISDEEIRVNVTGHKATLTGTVDSWYQKDEAGRIAWNAPGVWSVENELLVEYDGESRGLFASSFAAGSDVFWPKHFAATGVKLFNPFVA